MRLVLLLASVLCAVLAVGASALAVGTPALAGQTISWQTLAPATGAPVRIAAGAERAGAVDRSTFDGSDEDFSLFLEDLELMREMQPPGGFLNTALDGREVEIAGYVTPVGFDDDVVTEFLFVPFLGACVHVPPPEANQIIHVTNASGIRADDVWQPVWLSGRLRAKPVATVLADVGYRMNGATVRPYDGPSDALEGERYAEGEQYGALPAD